MRRPVLVVLVMALLTGCSLDGLQFTTDRRLEWVTEDRSVVTLPLTLEWELDGFTIVGPDGTSEPDAGYVAVFVDRSPQRPFQDLESLADDDDGCRRDAGCPDLEWFNARGVYLVTEGTSLTLDRLPGSPDEDRREFRDFTLVLLDGQGRRQGESAFRLRLEIDRQRPAAGRTS